MVRNFKFFRGISNNQMTVVWSPQIAQDSNLTETIDAESELTRIMSEEIARTIDNDILNRITRRINGGAQLNDLQERADYLGRWMDIGRETL